MVEPEVRNGRCGDGDVLVVVDGDGAQDVVGLAAAERHHHFLHHCNRHSHSRVRDGSADEDGGHGEGEGDDVAVGGQEPREACGDVSCRDRRNKVLRCGESPAWACSEVVATEVSDSEPLCSVERRIG